MGNNLECINGIVAAEKNECPYFFKSCMLKYLVVKYMMCVISNGQEKKSIRKCREKSDFGKLTITESRRKEYGIFYVLEIFS